MQLLMPHFERAAKLHTRLGALQAGLESLDLLASGVLLVRPDGQVWQMNRFARDLVERGDGLKIVLGRLAAWDWEEKSKLLAAIARASGVAMGNRLALGLAPDGALAIHRSSGKRPLVVFVSPLRDSKLFNSQTVAGAAVFVTDPEQQPALSETVLQDAYRLTPAQSRLAVALARGRDLNEYCEEAGVRRSTARSHLRMVFDKLGVRRQAELAAVVLNSQGMIRLRETK
jgi:DNA-binding CsgD family transcriptional regulator